MKLPTVGEKSRSSTDSNFLRALLLLQNESTSKLINREENKRLNGLSFFLHNSEKLLDDNIYNSHLPNSNLKSTSTYTRPSNNNKKIGKSFSTLPYTQLPAKERNNISSDIPHLLRRIEGLNREKENCPNPKKNDKIRTTKTSGVFNIARNVEDKVSDFQMKTSKVITKKINKQASSNICNSKTTRKDKVAERKPKINKQKLMLMKRLPATKNVLFEFNPNEDDLPWKCVSKTIDIQPQNQIISVTVSTNLKLKTNGIRRSADAFLNTDLKGKQVYQVCDSWQILQLKQSASQIRDCRGKSCVRKL